MSVLSGDSTIGGYSIIHLGNLLASVLLMDGVGSGIDAELFCGLPLTSFTQVGHTHTKASITDFPTALSSFTNDSAFITAGASITGNAATATKLATVRTITVSGDMTGTTTYDGSANSALAITLATVATAGTYKSVTINAKGLVTSGTNPTTLAGYGITDSVLNTDVVTTATANKILKLDANAKLPASITGNADGNAATATKWATARSITLAGDVTGTVSIDGTANVSITATVVDDSHTHDTRYYTETEADARFINVVEGTTISSYRRVLEYENNLPTQTGIIKITMPNSWTGTMLMIDLDIYDYTSNGYSKVFLGGYNNATAAWGNTSAFISGTLPSNRIRFAHDGTKCCILIGDVGTVWQYPKLLISKVHASYSSESLWGTGWSVSLITSETGIVGIVEPTVNSGLVATTANKLSIARAISLTGDATGSANFDGSAASAIAVTLATVATSGTYKSVTINAKGLVTSGTNPTTLAGYGITDSVNTSDVVTVATASKILKLDANAKLPASITGNADGNAATATKLATVRTISLTGDVTGSTTYDGSGNSTMAMTLATVATAGTYKSVTINAKGLVTSGTNPTTLVGYGITDATPLQTLTAVTPATLGWYRIATSAVNINGNAGLFKIDFSGVGVKGSVLFRASCNDGVTIGTNINQLGFVTTAGTLGLTKARVVYHTTPTANYAYVEVYNPSTLAITYVADVIDSTGWTLVTPSTVGSIPAGYTSKELTFDMGVVSGDDVTATSRLISNIATGTAPLVVASTTLVTNLNVDLLDNMHAATTNVVSTIVSRDASGNFAAGTITAALTGNATTATKLATTRAISLTGDATGTANFDGSAASAIAVTLATVATAGTYKSVTINAKGLVTSGTNPTTIAEYGITDAAPFQTATAATPATLGWYRIATSVVNINGNAGMFKVDFSGTGVKGSALFRASCHDGVASGTNVNQLGFTSTNMTLGLTQVRIVYHTTATANYAYVEVYNPTALVITYVVDIVNSSGWTLVTPSTAGSIPAGYTTKTVILDMGVVSGDDVTAANRLISTVATGTAPLVVASTTLVTNLNADLLEGMHAVSINTVSTIVSRDASGNFAAGTITAALTGNATTATKLATTRAISLTGDATGTANFDGSAASAIAVTLATVATAGTYKSVTINAKGLVTSGTNPTTIAGYGITDATPFKTLTASTPATLGWYRIATSAVNIGANSALVKVDFSGTGVKGSALFRASCHDGSAIGTNINQIGFTSSNLTLGLTQVRIVYHTTATANYAYVEVYNPTALVITYVVDIIDATGWSLVTPSTVGSIPGGYTSESLTLDTGIVSGEDVTANRQLVSKVAQGTPPIVVASNTVVPNLNSEKVNGVKITDSATAPVAPAVKDMWIDNVNNKIQRWNGSTWDNVSGGTAVSLRNTVIISTDTSVVAINIPTFDNNADTLFVYKNSTYIERVVDYTVSGDSLVINKVSGTWDGTVTPIRFNFVIIKNLDKSGVLTVPTALNMNTYENELILIVPQSNVVIGIPEFSALTDKLIVHKNGTFIKEDVDYTVNVDGLSVDNISGAWEAGAVIDFLIFKNVISTVTLSDPSLIPDGGIVLTKLNSTIQNRINTIDGLNEAVGEISTIKYTPSLSYGMNSKIVNTAKNSTLPSITFAGQHYNNIFGKDGNCDDISNWSTNGTIALDTTNKVYGDNAIKVTVLSGVSATVYKQNQPWGASRYYMFSAFVKNNNLGTGITLRKGTNGGGVVLYSSTTTSTNWVRLVVKIQPSTINVGNELCIDFNGAIGQYGYVDGAMFNEISATDYALSDAQLLAKYPYVDSYACLKNPYIEVRHDNLVRNGNGEEGVAYWINPYPTLGTLVYTNGKFNFTSTVADVCFGQTVKVKPNTNYYIKSNTSGSTVVVVINKLKTNTLASGNGIFNSGNDDEVNVWISNPTTGRSGTADSIQLVEGTVAPATYSSCRIEQTVVEGQFTSDDYVTLENGKVSGKINWKHKTLFGKDYNFSVYADGVAYKTIMTDAIFNDANPSIGLGFMTRYDGKNVISVGTSYATPEQFCLYGGTLELGIADTDSGWTESVHPNTDEIKTFMNGWRALSNNGTRYLGWYNILDKTFPIITNNTSGTNAVGQNKLNVLDGTKFIAGRGIAVRNSNNGLDIYSISSITNNQLTLTGNIATLINDLSPIMLCDDGTTNISILNYCKNNIAPGYAGYQLHYKLNVSETISETSIHIHGTIPKFDSGDNYITIDSGMVLGEVAKPYYLANTSEWLFNNIYPNINGIGDCRFNYKTEDLFAVYNNLLYDATFTRSYTDINTFGKVDGYILPANFDSNAIYTVDYKILSTIAPPVGTITCNYSQDISSVINDLSDGLQGRQSRDNILDTIIDLSLYENVNLNVSGGSSTLVPWVAVGSTMYINIRFNMSYKKVKPAITIKKALFNVNSVDFTSLTKLYNVTVNTNEVILQYTLTDATTITAIKSNGVYAYGEILADCRGRI
jgi:phage-related tail fiber protein